MHVICRSDKIKSDHDEVIATLEEALERAKSGDLSEASHVFIMLVEDDLDSFQETTLFHGRATQMLGYLEVAKVGLLNDILGE